MPWANERLAEEVNHPSEIIATVIIILIIVAVAGLTGDSGKSSVSDRLKIENQSQYWNGNTHYVNGDIKNTLDKPIRLIRVEFEYIDREGRIIGRGFASFNHLQPGATWRFRSMAFGVGSASRYRLVGIRTIPSRI